MTALAVAAGVVAAWGATWAGLAWRDRRNTAWARVTGEEA